MLNVPIIQSGLTQTETILQIANVFEYLDSVVNHVFDTITTRIDTNNSRVTAIQGRIETANQQVESLRATKRSIVICSPGRYPGRNDCVGVPATFTANTPKPPELNRELIISCRSTPLGESCIKEKLQFFHVRSRENAAAPDQKLDNSSSLSLGAIVPPYVDSVADLYLHNTAEWAYQERQRVRRVERREQNLLERSPSKVEEKKLDDATVPHSILYPDWGARQSGDNFFYTPTINDAPDLEMPDDLPDLPGIAIDIAFGQSQQQSSSSRSVPKATAVEQVTKGETKEEVDTAVVVAVEPTKPPPLALPTLPSFQATAAEAAPEEIISSRVNATAAAPPPRPPPPPPALPSLTMAAPSSVAPSAVVVAKQVVASDARSTLMEAIRKAGGKAKLRAAEPQPVAAGGGGGGGGGGGSSSGNLMEDLHKKLMMRRKGISGTQKPANVMDRLSALIPPPAVTAVGDGKRGGQQDEEEEDWN